MVENFIWRQKQQNGPVSLLSCGAYDSGILIEDALVQSEKEGNSKRSMLCVNYIKVLLGKTKKKNENYVPIKLTTSETLVFFLIFILKWSHYQESVLETYDWFLQVNQFTLMTPTPMNNLRICVSYDFW